MAPTITLPVTLARTTLRALTMDDLPAYIEMHARPEVARFLYWAPRTPDESRIALERKVASGTIHRVG